MKINKMSINRRILHKNAESAFCPPSLAEGVRGWVDSAKAESNKKNSENNAESAPISSLRDLRSKSWQSKKILLDSANRTKNAESKKDSSLRENERSEFSWQSTKKSNPCESPKSFLDSANFGESKNICLTSRSEVSHFRFCDSAILSPNFTLKSLIFSQKGCTPHPAPPTRQKLPLFAFRGSASLNPLLAKNRRLHYCNLESDFLHHEAGEIKGASHGFFLDSAFAESNANRTKNAESKIDSSLRGARSKASATKQSIRFATPNLAMANFAYQRHKLKNG
ncbi:hypothetical protein ACWIUD_11390 [Helicobacter sp. 23-1044]